MIMIILLYGSDTYRLQQNVRTVVDSYKKKYLSGFNFFSFSNPDDSDTTKLEDVIKVHSFFNETKLIAIRNFFVNKNFSDKLEDLVEDYNLVKNKEIVILAIENLSEPELNKVNKQLFHLFTSKDSLVRNFEPMNNVKLINWIRNEIFQRGAKIEPQAIEEIITLTGKDTWALANEIEKLCNFKLTGTITVKDVRNLVHVNIDANIFNLVDALSSRNRTLASELLYKELKSGRDPYYVLTMIIYQSRNLLMIKDLMARSLPNSLVVKKSSLHPFVVRKAMNAIQKFSMEELKSIHSNLLDLDTKSKLGLINLSDALFSLVLKN